MNTEAILDQVVRNAQKYTPKHDRSVFGYADEDQCQTFNGPCHAQLKYMEKYPCYWTLFDMSKVKEHEAQAFFEFIVGKETSTWRHLLDYSLEYKGVPVYSWEFVKKHKVVPWFNLDAHPVEMFGFMVALREQFEWWEQIKEWYILTKEQGVDKHLAYVLLHTCRRNENNNLISDPINHSYMPCPGDVDTVIHLAKVLRDSKYVPPTKDTLKITRNYATYWGAADDTYRNAVPKTCNFNPYGDSMRESFKECLTTTTYINHATWEPKPIKSKHLNFDLAVNFLCSKAKEMGYYG